jgi:hypothetical protein
MALHQKPVTDSMYRHNMSGHIRIWFAFTAQLADVSIKRASIRRLAVTPYGTQYGFAGKYQIRIAKEKQQQIILAGSHFNFLTPACNSLPLTIDFHIAKTDHGI